MGYDVNDLLLEKGPDAVRAMFDAAQPVEQQFTSFTGEKQDVNVLSNEQIDEIVRKHTGSNSWLDEDANAFPGSDAPPEPDDNGRDDNVPPKDDDERENDAAPEPGAGQEDDDFDNAISRYLPPPPPVPLDAFPQQIATLLKEAVETFHVPMQLFVAALLGMLSALVGGKRQLALNDSWNEPGVIWIMSLAASGVGKTVADNVMFAEVRKIDVEEGKKHEAEEKEYDKKLCIYKKKRSAATTVEAVPDKPEEPRRRQVYLDDATIESVGDTLRDNQEGGYSTVTWIRDELSGLIADMDKYSAPGAKGGAKSRMLSAYDNQAWENSRSGKSERNFTIPHAAVPIYGGLQPRLLPTVFQAGATGVDEASGFLQRFIPIRAVRDRPVAWSEATLSRTHKQLLASIAHHLWDWKIELDDDGQSQAINADGPAKALYVEWYNRIGVEEFLSDRPSLFAKLKGQAQRLVLLLHSLDSALAGNDGMQPVTEDTMRRGLMLADWIRVHQEQFWLLFAPHSPLASTPPIDKAIMECCVEHETEIMSAKASRKVTNATLLTLVQTKPHMKDLTRESLGKAAKRLGLTSWRTKQDRGYWLTADDFKRFKAALRAARGDEQPHAPVDKKSTNWASKEI